MNDELSIEEEDRLFAHLEDFRAEADKLERELLKMETEARKNYEKMILEHSKPPRPMRQTNYRPK